MPARTTADYRANLEALQDGLQMFWLATASISDEDLTAMRDTLSMGHTLGPLLDPTAYRTALGDNRLDKQERLVRLLQHVRREVREIFPGSSEFMA